MRLRRRRSSGCRGCSTNTRLGSCCYASAATTFSVGSRERGIDVLLIGTPEPGLRIATPAFYAAIAEDFGLAYEAAVMAEVLADARLKADPIHPNAAGYRVIAERVAERLRKSGAI